VVCLCHNAALQASVQSFSGTLGKSKKAGVMAKLTYNLRCVNLKKINTTINHLHHHHQPQSTIHNLLPPTTTTIIIIIFIIFINRYVTLKSGEGVLRYHESHGAFSRCVRKRVCSRVKNVGHKLTVSSGAAPKGEVNLKTEFQGNRPIFIYLSRLTYSHPGYSVVPEPQRHNSLHGIELKFASRCSCA
jgi:hypothetical protein